MLPIPRLAIVIIVLYRTIYLLRNALNFYYLQELYIYAFLIKKASTILDYILTNEFILLRCPYYCFICNWNTLLIIRRCSGIVHVFICLLKMFHPMCQVCVCMIVTSESHVFHLPFLQVLSLTTRNVLLTFHSLVLYKQKYSLSIRRLVPFLLYTFKPNLVL